MINKALPAALMSVALMVSAAAAAATDYVIDTKGMHAFIEFRIKHLGYSWLLGRFNRFEGEFRYDARHPQKNRVEVSIDVSSLDSNHAERDKHLRSKRFFDTDKYPVASFVSTGWEQKAEGKAVLRGNLTLRGITREIAIDVSDVGHGPDPWGGYRRGFQGETILHLSDWNMKEAKILGDAAEDIHVYISIEGIRK
ncbi:YceI family protein [Thiolapillus sp.]